MSASRRPRALALSLLLLAAAGSGRADEPDRHAGYFYPEPTSTESFTSQAQPLEDSDRRRRIGFTVELTKQMLEQPYPPDYVVFVKGDEADKLIVVALRDGVLDTVYRARAVLAQMTLVARGSPLFARLGVEDTYLFYDLCRLLGFSRITLSDGKAFSHQVLLD